MCICQGISRDRNATDVSSILIETQKNKRNMLLIVNLFCFNIQCTASKFFVHEIFIRKLLIESPTFEMYCHL